MGIIVAPWRESVINRLVQWDVTSRIVFTVAVAHVSNTPPIPSKAPGPLNLNAGIFCMSTMKFLTHLPSRHNDFISFPRDVTSEQGKGTPQTQTCRQLKTIGKEMKGNKQPFLGG